MTLLEARNLAIGYGAFEVARGLNLRIDQGSVTCLLGPNGIGKTTLFKTLLGLIRPLAGEVALARGNLAGLDRQAVAQHIAYVPQTVPSEFAYSVIDLVVMGRTAYLGPFSAPKVADYDIAMQSLSSLGIAALAERPAAEISGGQRQLTLIARALAQQSRVIVMDEPTASLDFGNKHLVLETIRTLARKDLAIILSTHDPEHAFAVADRVAVLGRESYFAVGAVTDLLTSDELTRLYGIPMRVERTPSGRHVVGFAGTE